VTRFSVVLPVDNEAVTAERIGERLRCVELPLWHILRFILLRPYGAR
jgi:hypothetical protein